MAIVDVSTRRDGEERRPILQFLSVEDPPNEAAYWAEESRYADHLKVIADVVPRDLRRFFFTDVFHDGDVEIRELDLFLGIATIRISCHNIKLFPRKRGRDWQFSSLKFDCTFSGLREVASFREAAIPKFEGKGRHRQRKLTFIFS